jgi:hypothetical protein
VFGYIIDSAQTDSNGVSVGANSLTLNGGTITDVAGNTATLTHTAVVDNASYMVDTTAPTFTSATTASISDFGSGITSATTVYTAAASDTGSGGISYTLSGGLDASLFNINSSTGVVSFKAPETYAATHDSGGDHVYDFTVSATDAAGNASTNAVALTMNGPPSTIAVYFDAAHTQTAGNLIAPVTVDGGSVFYYWDRSGDGTNAGPDRISHDTLDGIFNKDVNGVLNSGADTTDTYRYGTLYTSTGTSMKVALPTKGDGGTGTGYYANSTSVGNITASLGSNAANATYDDLLSIWDAYNGIGTGSNSGVSGVPAGWYNNYYWSATQTSSGDHANVYLTGGLVSTFTYYNSDISILYVAVQVL